MRICRTCGVNKPVSSYGKNSKRKDGLSTECKDCANTRNRENRSNRLAKNINTDFDPYLSDEPKKCLKCGLELPRKEFSLGRVNPDGLQRTCKKCNASYRDQYKSRLPKNPYEKVKSKTCKICKINHPSERYHLSSVSPDGLNARCKDCVRITDMKRVRENQKNNSTIQHDLSTVVKECSLCLVTKPGTSFGRDASKKSGMPARCKDCEREYRISERKRYKEINLTIDPYENPEPKKCIGCKETKNRDQFTISRVRPDGLNPRCHICSKQESSERRSRIRLGTISKVNFTDIVSRDAGICQYCSCDTENTFEIDHIFPLSRGGLHTKDNLAVSCKDCNKSKGGKDPQKFIEKLHNNSLGQTIVNALQLYNNESTRSLVVSTEYLSQ